MASDSANRGKNTPQYKKMLKCNPDLTQVLADGNVVRFAGELAKAGLINKANERKMRNTAIDEEIRAADLIGMVTTKVELNSKHFTTFLGVLEKDEITYGDIIKDIKEDDEPETSKPPQLENEPTTAECQTATLIDLSTSVSDHQPGKQQNTAGDGHGHYLSLSNGAVQKVYVHWNLDKIHKHYNIKGKGTTIAIIDSGINKSHPAFAEKHEISGNEDTTWDWKGSDHGTAVAAIAAGKQYTTDKHIQVPPGIAPKAELYIYRLPSSRKIDLSDVKTALEHILDLKLKSKHKIDVLVMSFGFKHGNKKIEELLESLAKGEPDKGILGTICIAAAGNEGAHQLSADFPARDDNVLSVGALESTGQVSLLNPQNNLGIDVFAIGKDVLAPSSAGEATTSMLNGTSYAVPMVAGFLALLYECVQRFPGATDRQAKYHDLKFLKQHLQKCDELEGTFKNVGRYFSDIMDRFEESGKTKILLDDYYEECYPTSK